jgi:hypothetical protein
MGLATSHRVGPALVYVANSSHPHGALVRQLLEEEVTPDPPPSTDRAAKMLRGWLAHAGAPLMVSNDVAEAMQSAASTEPALEDVVADGLMLAHKDSTVALVLPVVLWKRRANMDWARLVAAATQRDERQTLGFFLALAGRLGGDRRLTAAARRLRDGRLRWPRLFFPSDAAAALTERVARERTPSLALRWGYWMNLGMDDFESVFTKHAA